MKDVESSGLDERHKALFRFVDTVNHASPTIGNADFDMVRAAGESANEYDRRLEAELTQPKTQFQKNLGFTPNILAYPYERQDDAVVQRTKDRGYTAAFTVRRQGSQSFVDPYRIHRMQIYPEMNMDEFVRALSVFSRESIQ